ncbi:ionotropic glutamate receptor family protein [Skeletonema marinoi]|uniref:Ionotropic glutamate receptor family protein n=1 Tax=Skeletonema marinoi TaxID=267567 RepID=A0AAD8Y4Y2_9STRA|nr:ionotropic glutamate receptor family protein [Skeletonema marinoi]
MSTGNEGCNCINQTSVLASLLNRDCTTATGQPGVYLALGGSCVAYNYGSSACLQHDLLHDPTCQSDLSTTTIPPYCFQSWCYVNANTCKKKSDEKIKKTLYFSPQNDIFYSYSTCNSTDYFSQGSDSKSVVGGISVTASIPDYQYPMMNKQLPDGTLIYEWADDSDYMYYSDDTIPFGGIYIDYINELVKISNGDIQNVTFTHTSRASLKQYPSSRFTAAVQDVENGLVDMAVGPFWITGQRLKMTTFTVPLLYDKTVLVIPKPGQKSNLAYETKKVLEPFTYGLWGVVIAVTVAAALLSVWFSDREMVAKSKRAWKKRRAAYFRLILDAILEKGMFFFSAGIEQDTGASLPHKVLMFGFGFFILISVSAYVANLAAFLTRSGLEISYGTMREVIDGNIPICCHSALEEEIRQKWPNGKWVVSNDGFDGMFEAYARGDCKVLAVGREDTIMDRNILGKVCEHGLVYTDSVVTENPIAFPIRPQLASGFSYWMYLGEKTYGINLESAKQAFIEGNEITKQCEVELSNLNMEEVDDFAQVSPSNMILPIMAFVACVFTAVALQLIHEWKRKKGRKSSIGRKSTLDIFEGVRKQQRRASKIDEEEWVMPRAMSIMQRRQTLDNSDVDRICDFPGVDIPGDEFNEDGAPQSTREPTSILRGSIDDMAMTNANGGAGEAVEEDNDISHRIEELVESGVIDEVLDCFDFFQEMKKLKKEQ